MAFFLLGRVQDTVQLLCPDTFATRQDALNALSRVTAEPEFDLWHAEVLLLDTETGTPVLLVRPNAAAGTVPTPPEPAEELEVVVFDELDVEPETVGDAAIADAIVEEYVFDEEPDAATSLKDALARTAVQMESEGIFAPESISAPAPEVEPEAAAEAEAEPEADTATEPEIEIAAEAEPDAELAPEPAAEADEEPKPAAEADEEPAPEAETEPESQETVEPEPGSELAAEPDFVPALETEFVAPAAVDPGLEPVQLDSEQPDVLDAAWPWDVVTETLMPDVEVPEPAITPDLAYVLSDLEEPSLDDGSILRGTIDDETFAAARPVIMGSYGDESVPVIEPDTTMADLPADVVIEPDVVVEPMGVVDVAPAARSEFAIPVVGDAADIFPIEEVVAVPEDLTELYSAVETQADDVVVAETESSISDFILDLGTAPVAEETAPADAGSSALDEYTCADCIYEETCPNKDQRHPKDCGSFQWR